MGRLGLRASPYARTVDMSPATASAFHLGGSAGPLEFRSSSETATEGPSAALASGFPDPSSRLDHVRAG